MAKNNRSRKRDADYEPLDIERLTTGFRRTEIKQGREWVVQPISESNAQKTYTCPGCSLAIEVGVAHVVTWRNDGILGEHADLDARRHWHQACWRMN